MRTLLVTALAVSLVLSVSTLSVAQSSASAPAGSAVPSLVNYSGVLKNVAGHQLASATGVTFLIYKDEQGGAPLWLETQSVTPDRLGHYSVQLGAASKRGLPADLFAANEARWLAVQIANEAEQPRTLLVAVPYAMKAADAATIGGLPPSAFVLAAPAATVSGSSPAGVAGASGSAAPPASPVTTNGGTVNAIPLFTTATNIQNSILTQTAATAINVGGKLNLPANGVATATTGKNSRPEALVASVFDGSTSAAVAQTFQLQAEPAGNNTAKASGTLNLLYGSGPGVPAETGFQISSKGLLTFAKGQTFPGAGTITGVTAGADLTGGGTGGVVTLDLDTTKVPLLATANTFTASQVINGTLTASDATINDKVTIPSVGSNAVNASSSSPSATTIFGSATSTTGEAWGVEGITYSTASNAYGVYGFAGSSGGSPIGVYGNAFSNTGVGVYGQSKSQSATGASFAGQFFGIGTWGDGGPGAGGFTVGVLGSVDDGFAGYFESNSPSGIDALVANAKGQFSDPFAAFGAVGSCNVDANGNLNCTGTKNAVVPVDGGKRTVAMSAIESPVNWFEDAGSARLINGAAVVELDTTFIQTVNTEMDYKVFPVANGDCNGLYIANKTATSFEVRELHGGTSNVAFDYRVMAVRRNYETVRFADHTQQTEMHRRMMERMKAGAAHPVSHDPTKKLQTMSPIAAIRPATR